MRALAALTALPLVACLSACSAIGVALPTTTPVLIGPVDRIGGRATPAPVENEKQEFKGEEEMSLLVCVSSGVPTLSATHPQGGVPLVNKVHEKLAAEAGQRPLSDVTPRLSRLGTGAWVMFFAGCYGQAKWNSLEGTSEVPR